jgi:D-glycero-alpha-D-manno-heptose-7-phosphate kinase
MVEEAIDILNGNNDINDFGRLLDEAWHIKRRLSPRIAPAFVDEIYEVAKKAGALGGKLLGAGGGGFILFFVSADSKSRVLAALDHLLVVPIHFENSGSQIIFYEPDNYSNSSQTNKQFSRFLGDV